MSTDPRVGTQIGEYRIEKLLGRGGMSVVYLAEHVRLKRKAALKLLSPELAEDPTFRARFVSEWERLAQLDHPNIIPVFEAGEADGLLFIAMRYVQTTDLKGLIEQEGRLDAERAVAVISQTASALDAAHAHDLVHRDVKPANILMALGAGPEGTDHAYLADFGLTKHTGSQSGLTQTGHFMGTIDYVAPEQISGKGVDGRTDQYALACVLYQCLTGKVPFPREEDTASLFAHLQDEPPKVTDVRPDLPPEIDDVVARGMAKQKEERFESCTALARAARQALQVRGITSSVPPVAQTTVASAPTTPSPSAVQAPPPPPGPEVPSAPPPADAGAGRAGGHRGAIIAAALVAVVGVGAVVVSQIGGADEPGNTGPTGGVTGSGLPVLLTDDFSDPGSGWESRSTGGITQGYVDGAYVFEFEDPAPPRSFAVATGGGTPVDSEAVRITVDSTVLGQSQAKRDTAGVSCRAGGGGAYYFTISTTGGWSIQKLAAGQQFAKDLASSEGGVAEPAIAGGLATNRIRADCAGNQDGSLTLTLTVNGKQITTVDDPNPLPPGGVGLAAAGPLELPPAGFAVAFDDLLVEDVSGA